MLRAMELKACKFGGTSLADAAQLRRVKAIVEADPGRRWVVVSAPGKRTAADHKITDLFYLCHENAKRGVGFEEVFAIIAGRYEQIVAELCLTVPIKQLLADTRARIKAGETADFCASRGLAVSPTG